MAVYRGVYSGVVSGGGKGEFSRKVAKTSRCDDVRANQAEVSEVIASNNGMVLARAAVLLVSWWVRNGFISG